MKDKRNQRILAQRAADEEAKKKRMRHPSGRSKYAAKIKETDPDRARRLYEPVTR